MNIEQPKLETKAPWQESLLRRLLRYLLLLMIIVIAAIAFGANVFFTALQNREDRLDDAVLTLINTFGIFSITLLLLVYLSISSRVSAAVRIASGFLLFLILMSPLYIRPKLDGNLRIIGYRFVWQARHDEKLEIPQLSTVSKLLPPLEPTEYDYPQFLGPHRTATLPNTRLNTDWENNPPELVWRRPIGAGWSAFSVVGNNAYTLEQRGKSELVTCSNVETGKLIWIHSESTRHETVPGGIGPRSTPTVVDSRVYTIGATGIFLCLDAQTGQVIWRKELVEQTPAQINASQKLVAWGRSASPLVHQAIVVVPAGGLDSGTQHSLIAFDRVTGDEVWKGGDEQISYSSPVLLTLADTEQIVITNESSVTGHDPTNGTVLWKYARRGKSSRDANCSQPVAIGNDRLLLTKGYGLGAEVIEVTSAEELDQFQAEQVWANRRVLKTKFTSAVIHEGHAYALSDGTLECVDLETGDLIWNGRQTNQGDYGHGQILLAGENLLILSEIGELAVVPATPDRFQELGLAKVLKGVTWNTLCLNDDRLLIRNGQESACFKLSLLGNAAERATEKTTVKINEADELTADR